MLVIPLVRVCVAGHVLVYPCIGSTLAGSLEEPVALEDTPPIACHLSVLLGTGRMLGFLVRTSQGGAGLVAALLQYNLPSLTSKDSVSVSCAQSGLVAVVRKGAAGTLTAFCMLHTPACTTQRPILVSDSCVYVPSCCKLVHCGVHGVVLVCL